MVFLNIVLEEASGERGHEIRFESCSLNFNLKFISFRIKVLGYFLLISLITNY